MSKVDHLYKQAYADQLHHGFPYKIVNHSGAGWIIDPYRLLILRRICFYLVAKEPSAAFTVEHRGTLHGISKGKVFRFAGEYELRFWLRSLGSVQCYDFSDSVQPLEENDRFILISRDDSLKHLPDSIEDALLHLIIHSNTYTLVYYGITTASRNNSIQTLPGRDPPVQENLVKIVGEQTKRTLTRFLSSQGSKLWIACLFAFLFSQTTFATTKIFVHGKVVNNIQQSINNASVMVSYNSINNSARTDTSGTFNIIFSFTSVKQDSATIPTNWNFTGNYPNPFNPSTNIEFSVPTRSHVTLKGYDIKGSEIGNFVDGDFAPGKYKVTMSYERLADGVYFARFIAQDKEGKIHSETKKIMLLYGSQHNTNPVGKAERIGEADVQHHATNNNQSSYQNSKQNPQSTSSGATAQNSDHYQANQSSSPQHLGKTGTTFRIDSVVVSGQGISRTKFVDILVNSDSVDLGDLVVNSAPKQSASIPQQTLREVLDSLDLDLNQFISNDNATGFSSSNPKIKISGSHATFVPDSSDVSGDYVVRAFDAADPSLFVDLAIPLAIKHPSKLIVGPVYDLFTKYSGKAPIAGMKVYLGSEPSNNALTDAEGMATLKTWKAGKDSVFVVGATPADTAFYFWHDNRLNIVAGDNVIKAFNDATGIPTWQRFQDENGDDALDYHVNMSRVALFWKNDLTFNQTLPRFRDEDLPVKVWMGRNNDPTGGWYADSIWRGIKTQENSKLKFVEVTDSTSAKMHIFYTNAGVENGINILFNNDSRGPYLSNFDINFAGPPGSPIPPDEDKVYTPYVAAHGLSRAIILATGLSSPYKKDILFADPLVRYDSGIKDFGSEKERRVFEANFLLERNPKLLDYFR